MKINLIKNKKVKLSKKKNIKFFRKKWFLISAGVIFILLLSGLISYFPGKKTYQYAMLGKEKILSAQSLLQEQNLEEAGKKISEGLDDFLLAEQNFKKIRLLKYVPLIGRQLRAVDKLLSAGVSLGEAAEDLAEFGLDIFNLAQRDGEVNFAEVTVQQKEEILKRISESQPIFLEAQTKVKSANDTIKQIPSFGLLPQISKAVNLIAEKLQPVETTVDKFVPLVKILPGVFGYPEPKTYLFLLQNNTELRPTGGFIGTYGIVTLDSAEIADFWTDNIYNLDEAVKDNLTVDPPWQLKTYLNATKWFLRDSNWNPDFPTTAEKALWFYQQEGGDEKTEGVIAVTPTFIESLITLVGDITVHGITFNKDNFVDTLQYQVEQGFYRQGIAQSERKEVIGDLAKVLMDKVLALPQAKYGVLWETFSKDVSEKQILLYLRDESSQNVIIDQNWGGEVLPANGDYLLAVDCNLASLKSDSTVKRTIKYQVKKEGKDYLAKVDIIYDHSGDFDWKTTRYRTYTRIYVPLGSQLISSSGAMINDRTTQSGEIETAEESGKTVFGAFIAIEPQTTGTLSFEYKLPEYINKQISDNKYTLTVQKQSGTIGHSLIVDLDFDQKIDSWHPLDKGLKQGNNNVIFNTDLVLDRNFAINL